MNEFYAQGYAAAKAGAGILENPYPHKTTPFRFWVDGWCAWHSTQNVERIKGAT